VLLLWYSNCGGLISSSFFARCISMEIKTWNLISTAARVRSIFFEHLAIQVVMPRRLHSFSLCLFWSSLRLEFTFFILSWLGGFCSDGADGCEVQVLNEEGLWADGQVRQKFLHVCVPQVVCVFLLSFPHWLCLPLCCSKLWYLFLSWCCYAGFDFAREKSI